MYIFIKSLYCLRLLSTVGLVSFSAMSLANATIDEQIVAAVSKKTVTIEEDFQSWKNFHSVTGKCRVSFPQAPEHVKQNMTLEEDEYDMQYDVYVAAEQNKHSVFMVLIAQYPPYVNESNAELSLECFLNGILTQHPNNQLVFADLIDVQGHKGMDFFIKTKGVFFKGRAVMAGNSLYLVAMECEEAHYKDHKFNYFINSFQLVK